MTPYSVGIIFVAVPDRIQINYYADLISLNYFEKLLMCYHTGI